MIIQAPQIKIWIKIMFVALLSMTYSSCSNSKKENERKVETKTEVALETIVEKMQEELPIDCGGGIYLSSLEKSVGRVRFVCHVDEKNLKLQDLAMAMQTGRETFLKSLRENDESMDLLCLAIKQSGQELDFRFKNTTETTYFDLTFPNEEL